MSRGSNAQDASRRVFAQLFDQARPRLAILDYARPGDRVVIDSIEDTPTADEIAARMRAEESDTSS